MFTITPVIHPPIRAVIWDLDGMVVQIYENQDAVSLSDLELLIQFIIVLCQHYQIAVMTRQPVNMKPQSDSIDQYLVTLECRDPDEYQPALRFLKVSPCQSVVIGSDVQRLTNAERMGMKTIRFYNPRQAVSELFPLLAESLAE
jgi:hypothetical protein